MIWLDPKTVVLGSAPLTEVRQVSVEERAEKLLVEFTDNGPHPAFADVPERRSVVKIRRRVLGNENLGLGVGDERLFEMRTAPSGTDAAGVTVTATVVLTGIWYRVDRHDGAEQTIEAVAVSANGLSDPVATVVDGGA